MHVVVPLRFSVVLAGLAGILAAGSSVRAAVPDVGVAVLHNAPWSPADTLRDGAGEFEVLLCVARLQHEHRAAGLVSVGDLNGNRQSGGESALRRAVLTGVPVVKIATRGAVVADPDRLFLDAGHLTAEDATRILHRCLTEFGAPPVVADPERPTKRELAAIRTHLRQYQAALAVESSSQVAMQ